MVTFYGNIDFTFAYKLNQKRLKMKSLTIIVISFMLCITAFGQTKNEIKRKGLVFGTSFGIANASMNFPTKKQNTTNLAINWKVGYMINSKFALVVNGAVSVYEYDLTDRKRLRDFGGVFASTHYFITDKFWALGGIGIGTDAPVFYDLKPENPIETKYYSGIGAISSVGYEIYRKKNVTLDIQARINFSRVNLPMGKTNGFTAAILLGINFY